MDGIVHENDRLSLKRQQLLQKLLHDMHKENSKGTTQEIPRRPDPLSAPLSFMQERLWFLEQMRPGNIAYNVPLSLRITGMLKIRAIEQSFTALTERHEILRMTFSVADDGQPIQRVAQNTPCSLPILDMSGLADTLQQEQEIAILATCMSQQPFDLAKDRPIRVFLLRLDKCKHVLLLNMPHIVSDGWSTGVLLRDLTSLYQLICANKLAYLPPLPIQYGDFASWQREWLRSDGLETQLSYWKKQLHGSDPVMKLPTDRARPPIQTIRGERLSAILPKALHQALLRLSEHEGVTLFMTLLAAFQVLLFYYTGQQDILIGTPVANRHWKEVEGLIGPFVNTLVIRTDLSGNPSFLELLHRVRQVALEAYTYQDVPFEKLVQELRLERSLSYSPLFQVLFVLQNAPLPDMNFGDLTIHPLDVHNGTAKFDISLEMLETRQGLAASIEYNSDLFEPSTIARLLEHFQHILEGICAGPTKHLADLPMLSAEERQRLLIEWNSTQVAYEFTCLHHLIERQAEERADAIALVFEDSCLTYQQLNERANRLAYYLLRQGIGPEALVGVCMERSLELVVALLGTLKAGGAYVPLEPTYPTERLAFLLNDTGIAFLLTQSHLLERLADQQAPALCLDTEWLKLAKENRGNPLIKVEPTNLIYVIYTSGSTGTPKGAMNTQRGVCNRLLWMQDAYHLAPGDRVLQKTPFSFDVSAWEFFWPLLSGASLVLARPESHQDSRYLISLIQQQHITTLHFVPSMLDICLRDTEFAERTAGLRQVICSGEALSPALQALFFSCSSANLYNLYGPTEASIDVTHWTCQRMSLQTVVPIGRPISNTQIYLLDAALNPVPIGVSGELYIGGSALGRGYLQRADLTAERFIPHPFSASPGERLYRTGDLAGYLNDGTIQFLGRLDTQVKLHGLRIELGEIEAALVQHPTIRTCVVTVREERPNERLLVAYLVPVERQDLSVSELRDYLQKKLPVYMLPNIFVTLDSLPLTSSGKINRQSLPSPGRSRPQLEAKFVQPNTPIEKRLADIWAGVLNLEQVGIHDNFFALGGDSMRSLQVLAQGRAQGLDFSLQELFLHQTIYELAKQVRLVDAHTQEDVQSTPFGLLPPQDRAKLPAGLADAYPLTNLQLWMVIASEYVADSNMYYEIMTYRIMAPLQLTHIRAALHTLAACHPVLRTSFDCETFSEPLQLVYHAVEIALEVEELQHLSTSQQERFLTDWMERETYRKFDLGHPPLWRIHLFRLSEKSFQFCLSFHHAILDGWSIASFMNAFLQDYFLRLTGSGALVESALTSTYHDFVRLEREALHSQECRNFWLHKLRDAQFTKLPRWPLPTSRNSHFERHEVTLSLPLSEQIQQVARSLGVPTKSVLLAVHLKVLSLLSQQHDVTTGVIFHGRPEQTESMRVLGMFLNVLPFRLRLEQESWAELVRRMLATELEMNPYRYYPSGQIQRDLGQQALYEVVFNYIHFHVYHDELLDHADMHMQRVYESIDHTLFLTCVQDEASPVIELIMVYDARYLYQEQVHALGRHYIRTMEALVHNPQASHHAYTLASQPMTQLPYQAKQQLLARLLQQKQQEEEQNA